MSALSKRLQHAAERMAKGSFEEHVAELVHLAGRDLEALHEAIQDVQSKARAAGTPEHIEFTLLAAAWRRIADEARTPGPRRRGGAA